MSRLLRILTAIPLALLLYVLLLLLGLMSLIWNLAAMLLYPVLPVVPARKLGRMTIASAYRIFWALASVSGMMRIDASCLDPMRDEPGVIFVANHPTMLDALLLVARLPRSACIMKADLMHNIFLGAGARLARYISNDSARTMVRLAVNDLRRGGQLVVFPEGTRTVTPPLNPFRPGVTLIAKLAQAPIQTVFIDTDSPYLSKGWPLWRVPPLPIVFTLRLGQRFHAPKPHASSEALQSELEQYFRQHMKPRASDASPECHQQQQPQQQTFREPTSS
jgi:1-acyl-sn-glycerol-3-phosphate acyltransferase